MIAIDSPGEYAHRLFTRLGDRDWLSVLEATPAALSAAFDGADDATIRRPERAGKWSMLEVAQHLADAEMVVGVRVRLMLSEDRPPITAYDQEVWASTFRYRDAALADALAQFATLRAATLRLVRGLAAEDLARYGVHSERGGESVGYTLRLTAGHDLVHLDQIARIRRAVG